MRRLWLIGALVLLVGPVVTWSRFLEHHDIRRRVSPIDAAQPTFAAYWRFLDDARRFVPEGSSYTIKAANGDEETQLFMISAGLFGGVRPYPATYVWAPQPGGGREAKYVLVYGSAACPSDATMLRQVKGGSICIRGER